VVFSEVADVELDSRESVRGVVGMLTRCGYANCRLFDVLCEGMVVDGCVAVVVVFRIALAMKLTSIHHLSEDERGSCSDARSRR
jgi:hypothetical protein